MADPPGAGNGGEDKFGFLVRKIGPLPVWAWAVILVGGYYWYTHYGPGASSSSTATPTDTGDVTETENSTTGPVSIKDTKTTTVNPPPTGKPPAKKPPTKKPTDHKPPPKKRTVRKPNHKPPQKKEPRYVTVAKWPGKSENGRAQWNTTLWGIAQHEHVTLKALEQANPEVKDPNLIYPGERIEIP